MKIVYIAHPIGGDVSGNIKKVLQICRNINLNSTDYIPFVPYLSDLYSLDDNIPAERERGLKNCIGIIEKKFIDEMWLYGDRISNGMWREIKKCLELDIEVLPQTKETLSEFNYYISKQNNITSNRIIYTKDKSKI